MTSDELVSAVILQKLMMNLSIANFEQAEAVLLQLRWVNDLGLVAPLTHNITLTAVYCPYTCRLTAALIQRCQKVVSTPLDFNGPSTFFKSDFNHLIKYSSLFSMTDDRRFIHSRKTAWTSSKVSSSQRSAMA
jgi:hypothetical protein